MLHSRVKVSMDIEFQALKQTMVGFAQLRQMQINTFNIVDKRSSKIRKYKSKKIYKKNGHFSIKTGKMGKFVEIA